MTLPEILGSLTWLGILLGLDGGIFVVVLGALALCCPRSIRPEIRVSLRHGWYYSTAIWSGAIFIGFMSGISRVPVLGDVLPAVLVFLGGFLVVVTQDNLTARLVGAFTMPMFALMVLVGSQLGARVRVADEAYADSQARQVLLSELRLATRLQYMAKASDESVGVSLSPREADAIFNLVVDPRGALDTRMRADAGGGR